MVTQEELEDSMDRWDQGKRKRRFEPSVSGEGVAFEAAEEEPQVVGA